MADTRAIPWLARRALIGAGALGVGLLLTWFLVFHVAYVDRIDVDIFNGFSRLAPRFGHLATTVANLCDTVPYVFLCLIPVGTAIARRRPLLAAAIVLIVIGATSTTEILKPLLAAQRPDGLPGGAVSLASFPSGHATAAMALALCAVLASPARLRPYAAALGASFAVAVTFSLLTLGWHYPSDTLGGFLVAGIWTLLGIAALSIVDRRVGHRPAPPPVADRAAAGVRAVLPSLAAFATAIGLGALAFVLRPAGTVGYAQDHTSFVLGAAALAVSALVLASGVSLTLRR